MKKIILLFAYFIFSYCVMFSQEVHKDENQLTLYKVNNINKVSVISIGDKVKVNYSEPEKLVFRKFRIKEINKSTITTDKGETLSLSKIESIKDKTLGKSNKNEGITIFLLGAAQAGAYYALDTYASDNVGTNVIKIFAGFGAVVATSYGVINWVVGVSKSNKSYDVKNNWKIEVEQRKFHAPQKSPQVVK